MFRRSVKQLIAAFSIGIVAACFVPAQAQQVESQSSYYSVNDLRLHYGLGKAAKADFIEVRWPNGKTEVVRNVPANQLVFLKEGSGIVKSVKFG